MCWPTSSPRQFNGSSANSSVAVPIMDLKPNIRKKLRAYWQKLWDQQTHNKLHLIKPYLGNWPPTSKTRRTEVSLCRLRIGHTHSTHTHLLSGGDPPSCHRCGRPLTVLHILLECSELEAYRKKHFPLAYKEHIPLHPAMFIGREPLFKYNALNAFLKEVNTFHVIYSSDR